MCYKSQHLEAAQFPDASSSLLSLHIPLISEPVTANELLQELQGGFWGSLAGDNGDSEAAGLDIEAMKLDVGYEFPRQVEGFCGDRRGRSRLQRRKWLGQKVFDEMPLRRLDRAEERMVGDQWRVCGDVWLSE
ncbi:hypothetical protein M0R45_006063 [Rubus argutus]|uniref:Uncharacterized protein n=1 Tax=Rubus argutus TaxID=59490 RepID=A0AAW1YPQ4_RUBAR